MSVQPTHQDAAVAAVRRYIEAFNVGDAKAMAACFVAQGTILDGMAPTPVARTDSRRRLVQGRPGGG